MHRRFQVLPYEALSNLAVCALKTVLPSEAALSWYGSRILGRNASSVWVFPSTGCNSLWAVGSVGLVTVLH